ncbi:ADP compounds hydrolase NudE [Thalassotalea profundi]|uniref:ADP compounds hydrolase NudE n=1 Tax=Thalassotalea profundi TaxID=2036687 RepID=A0ABQ3J336_9GAMM|nr:ADP compounds hydrolase NudE [Thalassotalea profundi]GHE99898.1 ADP compounds hydrolase NudE [Thalassotalea profundi]
MAKTTALPQIRKRTTVARSQLFRIEQLELTFSNGVERVYERMEGSGRGSVMVVPMLDGDTVLLIREYCAGTHSYELGFPKGLIDQGEEANIAANRELKEEIGYGCNSLTLLKSVAMAPTFFSGNMNIYLAKDLYPEKLVGDEPEPLDVVPWKIDDYLTLLARDDFKEARSITALLLVLDQLRGNK